MTFIKSRMRVSTNAVKGLPAVLKISVSSIQPEYSEWNKIDEVTAPVRCYIRLLYCKRRTKADILTPVSEPVDCNIKTNSLANTQRVFNEIS